ncbi:MAG: aminotransferase class I/II-fold pyridoxal phosphate-dependent enzyme [Bacteroidota bacterium]
MAKINHNNSLDTIDELLTDAKQRGVIHLVSDINAMSDRKLPIFEKELLNFGTCGYLGLELDQRLKDGALDFTQKYGTQYGISRGYLSSGINVQLEEYLSQMFDNRHVLTYSSTSSAHISVIPTLITNEDAIILDQQVHFSVQTAAQLLRQKGVPIEMIRHSNMEMLEKQLKQLSKTHKKIWYLIDGVYSMYGDVAPFDSLLYLMDKYEQLHVYVDDAHGMSWHGKNGTGYTNSKVPKHEKIMLMTTMGKGFGVTGGLAIFPNEETYRKVRIFGGPLIYSHPLAPPIIGAAIASAKIHLSDDIYPIQKELRENIDYCSQLIAKTDLTVMSHPLTPIGFVAMGQPKVGYNMVKRLLNDGFFVNLALFPAVSVRNTGVRFSINRQVKKNEIKEFVDALVYHYPKVLEEENRTIDDVRKAFKTKTEPNSFVPINKQETHLNEELTVQEERSIKAIDKTEWDKLLGANGSFDWEGLLSLEDVFSNNPKPEENWDFYYFIIRDKDKQPVLATFFTSGISKDDMLALESVSIQIEEKRKTDPYYLTSKTLTMGSMLSEGHHYFINPNHPKWKDAFTMLLERVTKIQESINANSLLLRDLDKEDIELKELFLKEGFAPVNMPNSNIIENLKWDTKDELIESLSHRNRKNVRTEVFRNENAFEIEYKKELTEEETEYYHDLYLNVEQRNKGFNMFAYPKDTLKKLSKHPNWEFVVLKLKPEFDSRPERKAVAVIWCYIGSAHYSPMIIGMDYKYVFEYKVYKQAIYQVLKRARMLNLSKVYLGLSADIDKHKFGAVQHARVAYIQAKDNFNMEVIESMAANT